MRLASRIFLIDFDDDLRGVMLSNSHEQPKVNSISSVRLLVTCMFLHIDCIIENQISHLRLSINIYVSIDIDQYIFALAARQR